jgi:flagellar FliJ protein
MDLHQSMNPTNRFVGDITERKYSYIQSMIYELSSTAAALDCEIETAVRRSRLEPRNYAYPSYAKAAAQRRDNLLRTVENLKRQSMAAVDDARR